MADWEKLNREFDDALKDFDHWAQKKRESSTGSIAQMSGITRVEVIDENGRSYVNWKPNNKVKLSIQDNDKTLKIFILQLD
jgi:hypothetical protein